MVHVDIIYPCLYGNVSEYFYAFKTKEDFSKWVVEAVKKHEAREKEEYTIFEGEQFIGMISPFFLSSNEVEIGMWIAPHQQRKGFGKMALETMLQMLGSRGVKKVIYETDKENVPSINLATALGFDRKEGVKNIIFTKILG